MSLPSRKSGSDTIKRPNLLSRKPIVRQMTVSDMRWLWAAYKLGAFRELTDSGLSQDGFMELFAEILEEAEFDWMLESRGKEGPRPVGFILGTPMAAGRGIEPFVFWFPWATTRNQLEAAAAFLKVVSRYVKIFVFAEESSAKFWNKLIHRGLIRRGCKVIDYFSRGEHAMLYYTNGPD